MDIKCLQAIHHLVPPVMIVPDTDSIDENCSPFTVKKRDNSSRKVDKPKNRSKNIKFRRKPSILDARNSMLLILASNQNMMEEIKKFAVIQMKEKGLKFHPIMVVILNDKDFPVKFYVCIETIALEVESFLHCVNTYFKIFWVFDLEYPKEGSRGCKFLQELFFEVKSFDSSIPTIIGDLKIAANK